MRVEEHNGNGDDVRIHEVMRVMIDVARVDLGRRR
jgi:hypothetical protein